MAKRSSSRTKEPGRREEGGLWDSPRALTMIADVILLIAGATAGYALVLLFARMPVLPLHSVSLTRAPANLTAAQVEDAARRAVDGSFLTTDIEHARAVFESLPWVRRATVRRVWPSSLEVDIEEHVAVARWWGPESTPSRMINAQGELFPAEHHPALPLFIGPDASAASMIARHREWTGLLAPMARRIGKLVLTPREAWQLMLDDGSRLELGREDEKLPIAERLERYVSTHPELARRGVQKVIYADLRYPNGYAIRAGSHENQDKP